MQLSFLLKSERKTIPSIKKKQDVNAVTIQQDHDSAGGMAAV
jgi:hypothetical protein